MAEVRAADKPTTTRLGTTEEENVIEQPCIGSCGGVQFFFSSPLPIPETITVTGALGVTVGTPLPGKAMRGPWHQVVPSTLTTGTVRRLRVVSMAHARRPSRHPGWSKMRAGRRWARTVLTVLAVLSVLSNVASLLEGRGGFVLTSALVSLLLAPPRRC